MPRPGLSPERSASLRSRNAHQYVTRAALYGNLQEKCCAPTTAAISTSYKSHSIQKFTGKMLCFHHPGADFVPACAVEMQVNISQELLDMEIYRKNAAPRIEPRTQTHTLCASLRDRNASQRTFQKSHFIRKFIGKMLRLKTAAQTLCKPAQSKWLQLFTRAALYRNLQEKWCAPEWAPWSSTGPYTYRKNPSVWTHCLGQNRYSSS